MVPVPVPTFEKFRFRFLLFKSYGSGPVPVPAPYLDHKKQIFPKKFRKIVVSFYLVSCFTKKKVYKFQQIYGKM
jgi:hypothetical protein